MNCANPAPVSPGSALISTDHTPSRGKWLQRQGVRRVQYVPHLLRQLGARQTHTACIDRKGLRWSRRTHHRCARSGEWPEGCDWRGSIGAVDAWMRKASWDRCRSIHADQSRSHGIGISCCFQESCIHHRGTRYRHLFRVIYDLDVWNDVWFSGRAMEPFLFLLVWCWIWQRETRLMKKPCTNAWLICLVKSITFKIL